MRAALLCPGPSLTKAFGDCGCAIAHVDFTVGVNRASTFAPCDAWVAGDAPLIQQAQENVIGSPLLVTSVDGKHVVDTFERDFGKRLWRGESLCWTAMLDFCPHKFQYVMFSATAALIYCAYRGAQRIDVFGADWSGTLDYDGAAAGKNRSDDRWRLEREIWTNLVDWLAQRHVQVRRHQK